MTMTVDMSVLAVMALIAGIAAFIAPRFFGVMLGAVLCVFAVFQLFPEFRNLDLGHTVSALDVDDLGVERPESSPGSTEEVR